MVNINMTHRWYHPKYYAELRKQGRKVASSQAPEHKPSSLPSKAQASSLSPQAPGSEHQGTSAQAGDPGNKQQG